MLKDCEVFDSPAGLGVGSSQSIASLWFGARVEISRIFNLIEMKRFYAERLLSISRTSSLFNQLCQAGYSESRQIGSILKNQYLEDIKQFEEDCRELGLPVSAAETKRLIWGLDRESRPELLSEQAHCVMKVLESELCVSRFFKIQNEHAELVDPLPHFGEAVSRVFPDASRDIIESSACLALERYIACVFHSMLVLEHGLRWMCSEVNIPFPPYDQWQKILDNIERAIGPLPPRSDIAGRKKHEFLSGVASHFKMVKDGWRNHVSHGRGDYGPGTAESIYRSVRQIMVELAEYSERRTTQGGP